MLSTQETQLGLTTEIVKLLENEGLDKNLRSLLEQVLKLNAKWEEERAFLFRKCRFLNDELHTVVKNIPVSVLVLLSLSVLLSLNSRQEHSQTSNRH